MKEPKSETVITEEIEKAISDISRGVTKLLSSKLKVRTIALLIRDSVGGIPPPSLTMIQEILGAAARLDYHHFKKPERGGK